VRLIGMAQRWNPTILLRHEYRAFSDFARLRDFGGRTARAED
jgi:hypothetical protein